MLLFLVFLTCSYLFANFANGGTYAENYSEFRRTRFCNESSFRCDSGECITEDHLCDGTVHCRDGSDETRDCFNIIPCASDLLFQCDYGACINKARQCDGTPDCKDKSDETALACKKCGRGDFVCDSGQCISSENVCDGSIDCKDRSDETPKVCEKMVCPRYSYRCKYGACVNTKRRCDGVIDCIDGSDETGCAYATVPPPTPSTKCALYEFKCDSGECINEGDICNGKRECADGSDETFEFCAYRRCPHNTLKCDYGGCVPISAVCDGTANCWDGSDEKNCPPQHSSDEDEIGCVIPKNPDHGEHQIVRSGTGALNRRAKTAPTFAVLRTKCDEGYAPTPPKEGSLSICASGTWTPAPVHCTRTCPALVSSAHTECKYENTPLKSCTNAVHGTVAMTPCADVSLSLMQVCGNGNWDIPVTRCIPNAPTNTNGTVINIFYIYKDKDKR
ncbi:low-density lipoprotein receptor 1-like isoform X2 [Photinus pyralis]|uniref:low-density lipoprotein receptor 1-like isoform X2 n=1 Tax=Photinus pyralis TaxID=7054 RepID=UPI0012677947|nr:low-density lipoprotein receptor 1-like isoform X2 [Photinus pyralis]